MRIIKEVLMVMTFGDPRAVSEGVDKRLGKRNAPHLANLAWVRTGFFWDGRALTLEEQTGKPIELVEFFPPARVVQHQ